MMYFTLNMNHRKKEIKKEALVSRCNIICKWLLEGTIEEKTRKAENVAGHYKRLVTAVRWRPRRLKTGPNDQGWWLKRHSRQDPMTKDGGSSVIQDRTQWPRMVAQASFKTGPNDQGWWLNTIEDRTQWPRMVAQASFKTGPNDQGWWLKRHSRQDPMTKDGGSSIIHEP